MNSRIPTFVFVLFMNLFINAQTEQLVHIIALDIDDIAKQHKIDSLLKEVKKKSDSRLSADFHHDMGSKWYFKNWRNQDIEDKSNLQLAIKFTQLAISQKQGLDSVEKKSLKKSLYNLGVFQNYNEDVFGAIESYGKLISLGEPDDKTQLANREIAKLYWHIGDYRKAVQRFENCIDYYDNDQDYDYKRIGIHIDLADLYASMGYVEYSTQIIKNLQEAESLIKKNDIESPFSDARISQIYGNLWIELGDFEKALEKQSQLLVQGNFGNENLAKIYNSMGVCYSRLGEPEKSIESLMKSLTFGDQYSSPLENLGDVYVEQNDHEKAIEYYQQAIQLVTGFPKELNELTDLPTTEILDLTEDKLSLLNHLVTKANGWLSFYKKENANGHLTHALETFKKADELIDLIKGESTEYQSKLYWREQSSNLYMRAIEACFLLNRPEVAHYFMERNKALLLLEDLTHEDAKEVAGLPNAIAEREFQLKRAIHLSENRLQEEAKVLDDQAIVSLKDIVFANKYRYEIFIDSLENSFPNYTKFKGNPEILTLSNLSNSYLENDNAILYYTLNEDQGYGLLTTKDTSLLFQLEKIPELNNDIETLIRILSNGVTNMDLFKTISHKVFKNLIPTDIYQKIRGKQLTVIPDYILQQLPFETLMTDVKESKYLIEDVDISYAYSASLLDYNKKDQIEHNGDWLGIAPVAFEKLNLPELYFSESEVNSIANLYSGETLLNNQASKVNFIKNANSHNILHLATHADIGKGDNPWIAFNDSKMFLKEIYATKTHADMVVLSACNTSSGEIKRGEGVMSLARGFFYSGAKSVVSTLWPVADEAGKDILINFYKNLAEGDSKSNALQKAKLAYLDTTEEEELKHPYYWAGFVVLGDNSSVSNKSISPWLPLGLGLLGMGVLFFGYKKIKAHRSIA